MSEDITIQISIHKKKIDALDVTYNTVCLDEWILAVFVEVLEKKSEILDTGVYQNIK